jgi:O-antigen/teichoic acid export membrane protein
MPGIVLFAAARVLGNDVAARGRPLVSSVIATAIVACNITLNVLLIPRYGIQGAAWASTGSYSFAFLASAAVYCAIARVPLHALVVPRREDGARYVRLFRRLAGRPPGQAPTDTAPPMPR